MARNHIRLPRTWRKPAVEADASFEEKTTQRPRPGRPAISSISPAEEVESRARWACARAHQKLRGPVTGTEQLALGVSAMALMALLDHPDPPRVDGVDHGHGTGDVRSILAAQIGGVATVDGAYEVTEAMHVVVGPGGDDAVPGKADYGTDVRKVARGGGASIVGQVGGTERTEDAALRKTETTAGETGAPLFTEGAFTSRGPVEAGVITVAMQSDAPEASAPEVSKGQGRAGAEDAPAAEARGRAGAGGDAPAAETRGQVKYADLPGQAQDPIQHTGLVQSSDAAVGGVPASLATSEPVIHVAGVWPEDEGRSGYSQTYTPPSEKTASSVLHAADLTGANEGQSKGGAAGGGHGKAATSSSGEDDLPSDTVMVFAFGSGEKGGADAVHTASGESDLRFAAGEFAARSDAGGDDAPSKPARGILEGVFGDDNTSASEGVWHAAASDLVIL